MGAKQSKRSVDISGKEAESAGEVAAAGAGGEGRMEQLGDADSLKPQANGDAHIHDTTEKEKQLDSGTPENEKDATTEKEIKEQEEKEKEKDTDVPNGESESKVENGESTPSPDDGKKNKKEKVKKKWSLRSISFSRKEKPKQEKKQKDDEAKVPEEVADTTPEVVVKEVAEETKSEVENKDEKTPETPVTEPLTNGSSTPESPKLEIPNVEEPKNENECENIRPEPKATVVEPEQLPINGLSLEESKKDEPQVPDIDSNKTEEPKVEITETVPTPESPVIKEVCVDQTPLIEPTPPPLPANPPPSSVASFAATTMAPELSETSLAKNVDSNETAPVDETPATIGNTDTVLTQPQNTEIIKSNIAIETAPSPLDLNDALETQTVDINTPEQCSNNEVTLDSLPSQDDQDVSTNTVEENVCDVLTNAAPLQNEADLTTEIKNENEQTALLEPAETTNGETLSTPQDFTEEIINDSEISKLEQDSGICELKEADVDASIMSQNELNRSLGAANEIECLKAKAKEIIESSNEEPLLNGEPLLTNGDRSPPAELVEELAENGKESPEVGVMSENSMPSLPEAPGPLLAPEMPESCPSPPSELRPTESDISVPASPEPLSEAPTAAQEPLPVADKITELLSEIPNVPDLNTETETTTDVAVAN